MTFTTDLVTRAIRSCSNTKAFGPDKLSIFHLKHLGPRATAYLTALFYDSVNSSRIPSIWKSSIVIPIPKPGKDTSQGTSYRPISLICPAAKVLEALVLPTVNAHLLPADPTVQPMLAATKKETLQAVHTEVVTRAINSQQPNRVLHNRPPPISLEEDTLRRPQRTTLSQLRSGHCRLLNSYQNRLKQTIDPRCPDCGVNPHDVPHLFNCTAHPNALSTVNLWDKPVESIRELSFLDPRNLD